MKKLSLLAVALAAAAVLAGAAFAGHRTTIVTVAMHDPGCHWFLVDGRYQRTLSVSGPISLDNADEAALHVMGMRMLVMRLLPVGRTVTLSPGRYMITMVGQAYGDNHLLLVVK